MSILDMAKSEIRSFIDSNDDFSIPMLITPTDGDPFEINGLAFCISEGLDEDGLPILIENSHITICEKSITDKGYTTRVNGKLRISDWKVEFDHEVGKVKAKLSTPIPDHTLGLLKIRLTSYV